MSKKFLILLLVLNISVLGLVGCGKETDKTENETITQSDQTLSTEPASNQESEITQDMIDDGDETEINTEAVDTLGEQEADGTNFGYKEVDGGISIYTYDGSSESIVIPAQIDGIDVVEIDGVFKRSSTLTEVVIPETVEVIKGEAFSTCEALKKVVIEGNNLKEIGDRVFMMCSSLEEINLPDSIETLGLSAFGNCTSLEAINIPTSLTILPAAFNHSGLKEVTIPENIVEIRQNTFWQCGSLERCVIPASVQEMGNGVFNECPNVTIITPVGSYAEQYAKDNGLSVETE